MVVVLGEFMGTAFVVLELGPSVVEVGAGVVVVAVVVVVSQFNGTSTPKWSYRAKTGDNGCNVNSSHYSLSTVLCEFDKSN